MSGCGGTGDQGPGTGWLDTLRRAGRCVVEPHAAESANLGADLKERPSCSP
jgi:hypothetical protein